MINLNQTFNPDIVVIGGGPVGLWTAIQAKLLTRKEVLVVEKYMEYKRADIRLNIDASSFSGAPHHLPLKKLIEKWGNRAVPIKEMELELTRCAHESGIKIINGKAADPKRLQEDFPTAKVFVGADGAKSTVRKELFGDHYLFNTPLQYMAQVQYMIKTPSHEDEGVGSFQKIKQAAESYTKQKFAGHLVTQSIRPKENGLSQVTLRIIIDEQTYRNMADATFSNPYYFETNLDRVPNVLRDTLIKWWGTQTNQEIVGDLKMTNKMTVIPLASYAAKEVVKVTEKQDAPGEQVVTAIVGDAAQAYPYFRAVNNGFLLGTKLAQCIGRAFDTLRKATNLTTAQEKQRNKKMFATSFKPYSQYATYRAFLEHTMASMKNFFVSLSNLWIKTSPSSPFESIRLDDEEQKKSYQKGADIWEKLSGIKPPPFSPPQSLKAIVKTQIKSFG